MSKEADKEPVETGGAEQSTRRRRRSGLRVPSDNVPRNPALLPTSQAEELRDDAYDLEEDEIGGGEILAPIEDERNVRLPTPVQFGFDLSGAESDDPPFRYTSSYTGNTGNAGTLAGLAAADEQETLEFARVSLDQLSSYESANDELTRGDDSIDIPIDEAEIEDASVDSMPVDDDHGGFRAPTVALSDEDLEELIEPLEFPSSSRARREMTDLDRKPTEPFHPLDDDSQLDGYDEPVEPWRPSARESSEPRASLAREPGVPAAVAALEGAGMESPLDTPLELGNELDQQDEDGGEIFADDIDELIEVDEQPEVEVRSNRRRAATPPPAPPAAAPAKKPPPSPKEEAAQAKKNKKRKSKPWFEEFFDEDYLRTLPFLTPHATQAEAVFVARALGVEQGSQILDVGCGYGRHAMELSARGFQVVALDLSLPLLLRGADEAQRRGLNINFVHGDMRELNFDAQFDGAYCLFSTFGYFDDDTNRKAAEGIARALKPGARLVLEVLNRDYLISDLPARVWWEGDGCVVLEEVDFNYFSSRIISNRSVVFEDGRQLEHELSMRCYSLHELGRLLQSAGLRVLEVSGSIATRGRFFGNKSRQLFVVAERRADEAPSKPKRAVTLPPPEPRK